MEIVLIRHGEPDYAPCDARHFIGHGRALAPLSQNGLEQAEAVSRDPALAGAELIVSSPYPRALMTAAIISRVTGLKINVEMDIREWEPDLTYQFGSSAEAEALFNDFLACKGEYPEGEVHRWERIESVIARVDPVIKKYYDRGFKKIIIAAHGGVIRRFTGDVIVSYCTPYVVKYEGAYDYHKWVE